MHIIAIVYNTQHIRHLKSVRLNTSSFKISYLPNCVYQLENTLPPVKATFYVVASTSFALMESIPHPPIPTPAPFRIDFIVVASTSFALAVPNPHVFRTQLNFSSHVPKRRPHSAKISNTPYGYCTICEDLSAYKCASKANYCICELLYMCTSTDLLCQFIPKHKFACNVQL